jgi:predicted nucleic-acid-binding protein
VLAIDTNVIVRYLVDDDHEQFLRARRLIEGEPIFLANTVILECEWVLRSGYGFEAREFAAALRGLAGLPTARLESPQIAAVALSWHEQGMDFADALHLAGAQGCEAFATFDRRLAKTAARLGAGRVRAP